MSEAFFPGRAPIDSYGNGGFRFADMSHRGSLLLLPDGVYAWPVSDNAELLVKSFEPVFAQMKNIEFLLLGTGQVQHFPSADIMRAFETNNLGLDAMTTGAACRTYNVLLAEERAVAAAIIAVE